MVQKVRQKYEVVGAAPVYLEGASGDRAVAVADACLFRVAQGAAASSKKNTSMLRRKLGLSVLYFPFRQTTPLPLKTAPLA
jgi:hypothetical protein